MPPRRFFCKKAVKWLFCMNFKGKRHTKQHDIHIPTSAVE
uniref:Uncharacterized protein n=1 Tax=Anguilla anguilla TaxID=7936 RepID=A0A0E9RHP6_ANGAN